MKYFVTVALSAALIACGQAKSDNTGASNSASSNTNAASTGTGAAAYGEAGPPAERYRPYFDERWARGGAPVTPAEVEQMLRTQTPAQVVSALYGTGENSRWDTVASGVAKGDPAWLALAVRLSQGTDAGISQDFAIAASDALTTNPTGALRLLSQIPMGDGACTENGFEVPAEQALIYFQTARASLERVNDPGLRELKDACINQLRQGEASFPGLGGAAKQ
jgi:hypothetical protein